MFFILSCFAANPDPLQDICVADLNSTIKINGYPCKPESQVTSDDFFFSGLVNESNTDNPEGFGRRPGDVKYFPGLNNQGLTVNRIHLAPDGIIPLHVHPRANESNFVIKGLVVFGFITTNDVLYAKVMKPRELSIIPRGLVHFVVFNSQLPGFGDIALNLFNSTPTIPDYILAKNFGVDEKIIDIIKFKFGPKSSFATGTSEDI